jgi:hypothetical protein
VGSGLLCAQLKYLGVYRVRWCVVLRQNICGAISAELDGARSFSQGNATQHFEF